MFVSFLTAFALVYLTVVEASLNAKLWQSRASDFVSSLDYPETPLLSSRPNTAIGFTGQRFNLIMIHFKFHFVHVRRRIPSVHCGYWSTRRIK